MKLEMSLHDRPGIFEPRRHQDTKVHEVYFVLLRDFVP